FLSIFHLIIHRLCMFIEMRGMAQEGLFRISGNAKLIDKLKASFDSQGDAPLEHEADVASAAGLLKTFFRELPEPLIPPKMYSSFLEATQSTQHNPEIRMARLRSLIQTMPDENLIVLRYLCRFLHKVSQHEEATRMNSSALGIVFGPNLFRFADDLQGLQDQAITNQVVTVFIASYFAVFEQPLRVFIPGSSTSIGDGSGSTNIPALMINDALLSQQKRRSCSEERPPSPAQFSLVCLRRCSSSEDMMLGTMSSQAQDQSLRPSLVATDYNNLPAQTEPSRNAGAEVYEEVDDNPGQQMETDNGGSVEDGHDSSPVKCPRASAEAYDVLGHSMPSLPKRAAVTGE
ncbi:protein FAM13A-like, partial [Tropilaelaps mercedesae]